MKSETNTNLIKHLNERKDFKVIFDGEDFGIYKYDKDKDRYQGMFGYVKIPAMIQAIEDETYHIKLEII